MLEVESVAWNIFSYFNLCVCVCVHHAEICTVIADESQNLHAVPDEECVNNVAHEFVV